MSAQGTILLIGSSANRFELKHGKSVATGYYLNELAIPTQAAIDAGYDVVLATPDGGKPVMDAGSSDKSHFGGSDAALQEALDFVETYPAMQAPRSFRQVLDEGMEQYAGLFVPGGHAPMVDLMQDPELGQILRHFHDRGKPTALLCHGPIAVAAAIPDTRAFRAALVAGDTAAAKAAAAGWPYAGYKMTIFTNDEEHYAEEHVLDGKVPFYVVDALEIAGGHVEGGDLFKPFVVEDRELITGQNPPSDHKLAEAFVHALARQRETVAA